MSNFNATRDEIVAAAQNFAESMNDQNAIEHHGIKGMRWGVRNTETLRKYGLLKGASKGRDAVKKTANAIAISLKAAGGTVKKASAATVASVKKTASAKASAVKNVAAKKVQAEADKRVKKKEAAKQEAEYRKELGMSKRQFEKLREKTLKSHDPSVIAKGMHTLTDAELKAKIQRLETEGKVAKMATVQKQDRAATRKAQFEAIKSSPVYDIINAPLKNAAQALIFESITKQGLKPILDQRVSTYAKKSKDKFDIKNKQGNAWKEYQQERTDKAVRDYERKLEKQQKRSEVRTEKKAAKYANELSKQRRREEKVHEVSVKLNRDINRYNRQNERYTRVLNQGKVRNAQASLDAQANDLVERFKAS